MSAAFILAGIVFSATLVICIFILFADSMSDAPPSGGISPWPTLITGATITALLVLSHFAHLTW